MEQKFDVHELTPSPTIGELGFEPRAYESEIHILSSMVT